MTDQTPNPHARPSPFLLGCFTALGPFAIDLYLPAFPQMKADLGASPAEVQASLMVFFIAMAVGQLVWGPLSDSIGRRTPLLVGLALFVASSIGCALAPDIGWLILLRMGQGFGACAGTILARAVVRDHHTGPEAARAFAQMTLIFGVSPLFAPMAGSLLLSLGGWREIFWVVAGLGALGLVTAFATLGESLPPQNRQPLSAGAMAQSYLTLLRDRSLVWLTLAGACWSGATFTFLSVSSFVFTGEFHFSPLGYGLVFGVCASGMILSSQFNARLMQAIGAKAQLQRVSFAALAASAGLLAASSLHLAGAPVVIVGCFLLFACQGLSLAPAQVTVLDRHPSMAGAASALMGTVQMTLGAVASSLAATTFSPTSRTLILMQFACMILIVVLVRIAFSSGEGRGGLESSAEA